MDLQNPTPAERCRDCGHVMTLVSASLQMPQVTIRGVLGERREWNAWQCRQCGAVYRNSVVVTARAITGQRRSDVMLSWLALYALAALPALLIALLK